MFNTNSNLLSKSGLSVDQINNLLAGHGKLVGLGQAFIDVENRDGVNAFWGMAQAIEETGWGTSAIAQDKNNLFGITAYDSNPYGDASVYNSPADCVEYWGDFISKQYLNAGGAYFVSPTPSGVARHWATDPNYAAQVTNIMNLLVSRLSPAPAPAAPAPVETVSGNSYVVKAGDNMGVIAQRVGLSLGQLEAMNPQAGHPSGNFNNIWPNDVLHVGAATPAPAPASDSPQYVNVQAGQNMSVIAEAHGLSLNQLETLNPNAGHPVGNFGIIWPNDKLRVK
jgi:LysM repeat protein